MIRLTLESGLPVILNPAHIVSASAHKRTEYVGVTGTLGSFAPSYVETGVVDTVVKTTTGAYTVTETVEEVMSAIRAAASFGPASRHTAIGPPSLTPSTSIADWETNTERGGSTGAYNSFGPDRYER